MSLTPEAAAYTTQTNLKSFHNSLNGAGDPDDRIKEIQLQTACLKIEDVAKILHTNTISFTPLGVHDSEAIAAARATSHRTFAERMQNFCKLYEMVKIEAGLAIRGRGLRDMWGAQRECWRMRRILRSVMSNRAC